MRIELIVLSLLAAFSIEAKGLTFILMSDVEPEDNLVPATTGRYDSLISDIMEGKKISSKNILDDREFVEAMMKKYGTIMVERFSPFANPTVDLQERTSQLVADLVDKWLTLIKELQGSFFERAASVLTKASLAANITKYIYDIGDFSGINYISFLLDGKIVNVAKLVAETNGLLDDPEMNLDNGNFREVFERTIDAIVGVFT